MEVSRIEHKIDWGPGFRFFKCECGHEWKESLISVAEHFNLESRVCDESVN